MRQANNSIAVLSYGKATVSQRIGRGYARVKTLLKRYGTYSDEYITVPVRIGLRQLDTNEEEI